MYLTRDTEIKTTYEVIVVKQTKMILGWLQDFVWSSRFFVRTGREPKTATELNKKKQN